VLAGWRVLDLRGDGSALDAVESAVRAPRGRPRFTRTALFGPEPRRHDRDGRVDHWKATVSVRGRAEMVESRNPSPSPARPRVASPRGGRGRSVRVLPLRRIPESDPASIVNDSPAKASRGARSQDDSRPVEGRRSGSASIATARPRRRHSTWWALRQASRTRRPTAALSGCGNHADSLSEASRAGGRRGDHRVVPPIERTHLKDAEDRTTRRK